MINFDRYAAAGAETFAGGAERLRMYGLAMIENGSKQPNFATLWPIANGLQMAPPEPARPIGRMRQ